MIERKFCFIPVRPLRRKPKEVFYPYVSIQKSGVMVIGKKALEWIGVDRPVMVRLFEDVSRRTVGFQIEKSVDREKYRKEDGYRVLSPKSYKGKSIVGAISVRSFLNQLSKVVLPSQRLRVRKYKDTDPNVQLGEIFYVRVPYGEERVKLSEET